MLMMAALAFVAPAIWGDLLSKPVEAWDARLGAGKSGASSKGKGDFTLRTRRYRNGTLEVTFLGGKPSSVEIVLPVQPSLTWSKALGAAALPTRGAKSKDLGATSAAGVSTQETLVTLPDLPKGVLVTFTQRRAGGKLSEQTVGVIVPEEVRLAPDATERKAILDAARAEVLKSTRQKVIFRVSTLRVGDGWAFLEAEPRTPADKPADWSRLNPAGFEAGAYDPTSFTLLRKKGAAWRVISMDLGPTDVAWAGWSREFKAPYGLFSDKPL